MDFQYGDRIRGMTGYGMDPGPWCSSFFGSTFGDLFYDTISFCRLLYVTSMFAVLSDNTLHFV